MRPCTDMKTCTKCNETKPRGEFHRRRDGLQPRCKTCKAEYYAQNRAHIDERQRKWRGAHPERKTEYDRVYRAANRARERERVRAWRQANPEKDAAITARRRAAKLQRTPAWSDPVQIAGFYSMAARVSECLGIEHHVDHVIPLQGRFASGLHVHTNLRVIPGVLNVRKGNRFVAFDRAPRRPRVIERPRWITRAKANASRRKRRRSNR